MKSRKPPAATRPWRRWMALSCNHGIYGLPAAEQTVLQFVRDYRPHLRIHLGDNWDTTAWRAGARNTRDEGADVAADWCRGAEFLGAYRPQLFFAGNHEHRIQRYLEHPSALLRAAAVGWVRDYDALMRRIGAECVPYHILTGWRLIGGAAFGHGYMFNEHAARDHAEMLGRTCVIGHLHTVASQPARVLGGPVGHCVGCLADIMRLDYAASRRAVLRWANGFAFGEYCDNEITIQTRHIGPRLGGISEPLAAVDAR